MRILTDFEAQAVCGGRDKATGSGGGFFSSLWHDIENAVSDIFDGGGDDPLPTSCTSAAQTRYVNAFEKAGATAGAIESIDKSSSMGAMYSVFTGGAENRQKAIENIKKVCGNVHLK